MALVEFLNNNAGATITLLLTLVLVALTVLTLAFLLTRVSGDLAISIAGPNATVEDVETIRRVYGLNRPLYVQYFDWLGRAVQGDFGDLTVNYGFDYNTRKGVSSFFQVVAASDDVKTYFGSSPLFGGPARHRRFLIPAKAFGDRGERLGRALEFHQGVKIAHFTAPRIEVS